MDTEEPWHKDTSGANVCGCVCVLYLARVCEVPVTITYAFKIILPQTLDN